MQFLSLQHCKVKVRLVKNSHVTRKRKFELSKFAKWNLDSGKH